MQNQKILILNFGGQYGQLIARRVRECDVSCLLFDGLDEESISWMSHGDYMKKVPEGCEPRPLRYYRQTAGNGGIRVRK